jgi:hypothetical protein
VEELFSLPARTLGARHILKSYHSSLKQIPVGAAADEHFDTLYGDQDREQLRLVQIGGPVVTEAAVERPPKAAPVKRKRAAEAAESAYAKRQQELARRQEEFAQEEAQRRQQQQLGISLPSVELTGEGQEEEEDREQMVSPHPAPSALEQTGASTLSLGGPPLTPLREPDLFAPGPPAAELTPALQVTLTQQWVSQVQTAAAAVPEDDDMDVGFDAALPYEEVEQEQEEEEPCEAEEEEAFPADIEAGTSAAAAGDESSMQEDETIEQYEDRVLNKRAAQMHRHLAKRFESAGPEGIDLSSLLRKNNRKQVAQKFYSILVLQKVMAVDANQSGSEPFGPISILMGPKFKSPLLSL